MSEQTMVGQLEPVILRFLEWSKTKPECGIAALLIHFLANGWDETYELSEHITADVFRVGREMTALRKERDDLQAQLMACTNGMRANERIAPSFQ